MASEDLAGTLAAVLGGRGLRVQNYDSGPAGETPAQVRLRKNVCYVVLAVFLNEQVWPSGWQCGQRAVDTVSPACPQVEFSRLPRRQMRSPCRLAGTHEPRCPPRCEPTTFCI